MVTLAVYIDTSVLLACADSLDKYHYDCRRYMAVSTRNIVSSLTMVELSSVLSRRIDEIVFPNEVGEFLSRLPFQRRVEVVIKYLMKRFKLDFLRVNREILTFIGVFPEHMGWALRFAPKMKLKTLDLLHISIAYILKRDAHIVAIATLDKHYKEREKEIYGGTGIRVDYIPSLPR